MTVSPSNPLRSLPGYSAQPVDAAQPKGDEHGRGGSMGQAQETARRLRL